MKKWLRRIFKRRPTVSYVYSRCQYKEEVPEGILEEFDLMFPERLLQGPHQFYCDKCHGIMEPEEYESHVIGYGLYEGLSHKVKKEKERKRR